MVQENAYRVLLAYDGTDFCGWEKQAQGERTVQGVMEGALERLDGGPVTVHGAGRTDSGVHALGQVASFRLTKERGESELFRALNALLPRDMAVRQVRRCDPSFHPRFSARHKTYFYQLLESPIDDPFRRRYWHRLPRLPEVARLRAAASLLIGEQDFSALRAAGSDAASSVRRVISIKARRCKGGVRVFFTADGFLYRMVRNMISFLVATASGEITAEEAERILADRNRSASPPTFPAKGLFLWKISY